VSFSLTKMFF